MNRQMYHYSFVLINILIALGSPRKTRKVGRDMIGGVDIGGTKIAVGVVDRSGGVLAKNECATDVQRGFDHAMQQVTTLLQQCAEQAKVKLDGIGIGCAGPLDSSTGTLGNVNNLPGWKGGN